MEASEILLNVFFYLFAAGAVGGAAAVAVSRNIVRSAFALLAVLFSAAALYAIMKADFIAAAQVLIYVGGILVLIIFAVMLTHKITDVNISNESTPGPAAFFACLCLLFSLVVVVLSAGRWQRGAEPVPAKVREELTKEARAPREFELVREQYQADGRTGIQVGGNAFEERVILIVRVPRAAPDLQAVVEAYSVERDKAGARKLGKKVGGGSAAFQDGSARFDLQGLPEGETTWRARLSLGDDRVTEWTRKDGEAAVDFHVYRGVTEPAALALMGPYLFAFEAVSVLLLAALVGAAYLARKEVKA